MRNSSALPNLDPPQIPTVVSSCSQFNNSQPPTAVHGLYSAGRRNLQNRYCTSQFLIAVGSYSPQIHRHNRKKARLIHKNQQHTCAGDWNEACVLPSRFVLPVSFKNTALTLRFPKCDGMATRIPPASLSLSSTLNQALAFQPERVTRSFAPGSRVFKLRRNR